MSEWEMHHKDAEALSKYLSARQHEKIIRIKTELIITTNERTHKVVERYKLAYVKEKEKAKKLEDLKEIFGSIDNLTPSQLKLYNHAIEGLEANE